MTDVGFVALSTARAPDPTGVIASARKLGVALSPTQGGDTQVYDLAGRFGLCVGLMPTPYPSNGMRQASPFDVPAGRLAAAPAHLIVSAYGLHGSVPERDLQLAALLSAVVDNVAAVGAKLGHGLSFFQPAVFSDLAATGIRAGVLPPPLAIDITAEWQSPTHASMLTHHLPRYGRENFYVTCPVEGTAARQQVSKTAMVYVYELAGAMISEPTKHLPTGDTVQGPRGERVLIQRVPSPTGNGETVIRLDLR